MNETIYPKGLRTFPPHAESPDFVKGTLIVTLNELVKFCKENGNLLTEYNSQKQLKCDILEGDKGLYIKVNTWRPDANQQPETPPEVDGNMGEDDEPLPF